MLGDSTLNGSQYKYFVPEKYINKKNLSIFGHPVNTEENATSTHLLVPSQKLSLEEDKQLSLIIFSQESGDELINTNSKIFQNKKNKFNFEGEHFVYRKSVGGSEVIEYWNTNPAIFKNANLENFYFVKVHKAKEIRVGDKVIKPKDTCDLYSWHDGLSLQLGLLGENCSNNKMYSQVILDLKELISSWAIK